MNVIQGMRLLQATCVIIFLASLASLPTHADIVYSPNQELRSDMRGGLAVNVGGHADFRFDIFAPDFPIRTLTTNGPVAAPVFERGSEISDDVFFRQGGMSLATWLCNPSCEVSGPWANVTHKYLGFELDIDGESHYGWMRMSTEHDADSDNQWSYVVHDWAYESTPGEMIIAGATQSFVSAGEVRLSHDATYNLADSDIDDRGDQRLGGRFDVGEKDLDLLGREKLSRQVVKFELPDIRNGLESAKLRVFLEQVEGVPTGAVSIFHSIADNDLEPTISDYEDASYVDTFLDIVWPEDEERQYYELDVTEFVLTDYANDGDDPHAAFRFEVSEATFVNDGRSNFYRFTHNVNRPELALTFVAEPSAGTVPIFALAGVTCLRRRARG